MPDPSRAVLITGCSSGIGHATALRLARDGWTVYATARSPETLTELQAAGCARSPSTSPTRTRCAQPWKACEDGAVGVLINNAGYSQSGAVESVPLDNVRRQFETNVFGLLRLRQLVLPGMRAQRWGKVVNLSSMGGRLTFPGGGLYHATKYAVEALTDALRFEVRGFGIDVMLIEPGPHRHPLRRDGGRLGECRRRDGRALRRVQRRVAKATKAAYRGPMAKLGGARGRGRRIAKALRPESPGRATR